MTSPVSAKNPRYQVIEKIIELNQCAVNLKGLKPISRLHVGGSSLRFYDVFKLPLIDGGHRGLATTGGAQIG